MEVESLVSAENEGKAPCVSLHTQHKHHGQLESLPPKPQAEVEVQPSFTGRLERDPVLLSLLRALPQL